MGLEARVVVAPTVIQDMIRMWIAGASAVIEFENVKREIEKSLSISAL